MRGVWKRTYGACLWFGRWSICFFGACSSSRWDNDQEVPRPSTSELWGEKRRNVPLLFRHLDKLAQPQLSVPNQSFLRLQIIIRLLDSLCNPPEHDLFAPHTLVLIVTFVEQRHRYVKDVHTRRIEHIYIWIAIWRPDTSVPRIDRRGVDIFLRRVWSRTIDEFGR